MYIEYNPKTLWREEFEADNKDFKVENTVGDPTPNDIKDLPESVNLLDWLPRTYNQWALGACTAYALTHIQLFNNVKEFESDLVEMDPLSLRKNMGHDPANKEDSWDYLENALKHSTKEWINGRKPDGKSEVFLASSYAFKNLWTGSEADFNNIKYYLNKWYPLYTAIKGTSKTWRELSAWELVTVFPASQTTWGHAVAMFGIDDTYVYFANSWAGIQNQHSKLVELH